ncbi:hypothetical protein G4B88_009133 [Cannabis sativa]|uniref:Retrotransposon gag domain-containing protein n=1 Tax=Cannabis sativa TaxID=3483 RepID=A0A7J6HPS7_CANSA|nr:hypothetical protein G4B88_009133 [Cannabis sativa]
MVRDDVFMAKAQRRPEVRGLMEETLASGSRGETRCGIADSRTGTPATTRMNGLTERYFGLQRLSPPEQLEAAVLCLEGAALNWFRWENQRQAIKSWEELKSLLLRRFRPKAEASTIEPMGDQALQAAFLKGLKIEIQAPLRILEPNGLVHMMDLAEQVKANQALTRLHRNGLNGPMRSSPRPPLSALLIPDSSKGTYVTSPISSSHSTQLSPGASSKQSSSQATSPVYRRYTESEIQEKKRKGLCFKCDGRWSRGHECSQAEVQILLQQEELMEEQLSNPWQLEPPQPRQKKHD